VLKSILPCAGFASVLLGSTYPSGPDLYLLWCGTGANLDLAIVVVYIKAVSKLSLSHFHFRSCEFEGVHQCSKFCEGLYV
jgi:hypothetical protein